MQKLHWSGTVQTLALVDLVDPADPTDNVTHSFTGLVSSAVWTGGSSGGKIVGTASSDLIFLDDGASSAPLLQNIVAFNVGAGDDVVDLTSSRFQYAAVTIAGGDGNDWLWGNAGPDRISGGGGEDRLKGGDGNDVIVSGADNDQLFGGSGRDRFVFRSSDGNDNIYDFVTAGTGHDVIDLRQQDVITDFTDLMQHHALMENGELKITLEDGNYVRLYGLDITDLRAADFLF